MEICMEIFLFIHPLILSWFWLYFHQQNHVSSLRFLHFSSLSLSLVFHTSIHANKFKIVRWPKKVTRKNSCAWGKQNFLTKQFTIKSRRKDKDKDDCSQFHSWGSFGQTKTRKLIMDDDTNLLALKFMVWWKIV